MRSRRLLPSSVVVAVLLAGLMGGCTRSEDDADATTTTVRDTPTTDPTFRLSPEDLVATLVLGEGDTYPDEDVETTAQGDPEYHVDHGLAYCSYRITAEAGRTDRRKVQLVDEGSVTATSDAVLYAPGDAEQALRELRSGIERCPAGEAVPPGKDDPPDAVPTVWSQVPLADSALDGLADDRVATAITRVPEGGEPTTEVVIVQRRGDVLVITASPDESRALRLATTAADRLTDTDSYLFGD